MKSCQLDARCTAPAGGRERRATRRRGSKFQKNKIMNENNDLCALYMARAATKKAGTVEFVQLNRASAFELRAVALDKNSKPITLTEHGWRGCDVVRNGRRLIGGDAVKAVRAILKNPQTVYDYLII